jgi:zinc transporter 1/2/3
LFVYFLDVFMHLKHEHTESTDHEHNHGTLPFSDILVANSLRDIINAYALEISTAIHSIVIGFDLGVLHDSGDVGTIVMLMIVLSVHQFIEGLGLGAVIKTSEARLGNTKVLTFILIFCSTVSLGVFLGLVAAPAEESNTQLAVEGGATALASGSLLYISLVDMTSHYFNLPSLEDQKSTKVTMLLVFALGASILGIIGIWA